MQIEIYTLLHNCPEGFQEINQIKNKTMKNKIAYLIIVLLSFTFIPNEMKATSNPAKTEFAYDPYASKIILVTRLDEINAMDKSKLSRSEKNALRKEVRSIDKKLHNDYGGIYISVGAAILIIFLLIILF